MAPEPSSSEFSGERYVIYRLRDGERQEIASAPSPAALGLALVTLGEENEFVDGTKSWPLGIFDAQERRWLVKPWLPFPTPKNASEGGRALALARWSS